MKRYLYLFFWFFLRVLVWLKRVAVWAFHLLVRLGNASLTLWRRSLGIWWYKAAFLFTRIFRRLHWSWEGGVMAWLGERWTLQVVVLVMLLIIMIPHSRVYTRPDQAVPGRGTVLYQLVGPGDLEFEIEEIEVDLTTLSPLETRSWREGAVIVELPGGGAVGLDRLEPQEIVGVSAGGAALAKPSILPGTQLPSANGARVRTEIVYHTVQPGEVIVRLAELYGVEVETILWANNLSLRSYIRPGDKLKILPTDGVIHQVRRGETMGKISQLYKAKPEEIIKFNKLQEGGADIVVGEELVIPGGVKPQPVYVPARRPSGFAGISAPPPLSVPSGSGYIWPTTARHITQYFGWRHTGLDIAGPAGTPVYASLSGVVTRSSCGWNGGYGCYIIIDHGNGLQTLYGHNSRHYVSVGEAVTQGQTIAAMGSTGRSTGSHVHFEIRVRGSRQNPLRYVR